MLDAGLRGIYGAAGRFLVKRTPSAYIPPAPMAGSGSRGRCFTVGVGEAELLPPDVMQKTYYVAGYSENNPATGVLDVPTVTAVWLDDNTGAGALLLLSFDAVGLLQADVERIRERLHAFAHRHGCREIHVLCTHNHASIDTMGNWGPLPRSGRDEKYMQFLIAQAERAAVDAFRDRREGTLSLGETEVPDMQDDHRTPFVYSRTLTRFRFVPRDGSREVWLVHFASHSESLQGCNSRISADFPGCLRRAIRDKTGAQTLYMVGAIGGMITMRIENEAQIRAAGGDFAASTRAIGEKLAEYAMAITKEQTLTPCIRSLRQAFYIGVDNTMLLTAKFARILRAKTYFREQTPMGLALRTEMTYLSIGEKNLLLLPGELFPELAYGGYLPADASATGKGGEINPVPLTQIAGDPSLLIVGMANDEIGYIVPPNDFLLHPDLPYFRSTRDRFDRNHYEETNSLGQDTAQTIADVFASVMRTVHEARNCAE